MLLASMTLILCACGAKRNTAMSRFWQAFTTRYNVYYNGMTNYEEQIKILENDYQDDYSQHLFIHPSEARMSPKSPQPSGSFDRTIEKMQKAISLHSIKKKPAKKAGKSSDPKYKEYLKREEYNPFIHNAWFMLAKAEYMKGDFLASSATFHYISRHFTWKPDLVLESQIWEALSYCAMGWTTEADNVLAHVHIDKIGSKRVRALANLAFADLYIKSERNAEAIPYLAEAIKGSKGAQKVRLNFLLGQLYEDAGEKQLAYEAFKRAGSYSGSSYRTKFNARIKQSAVYQGTNIVPEVKALKRMARYDRNKEYLDQVYYAIGNLYLSRLDTANAVANYKLAAEKSTRNGIDKAISQLTLGGIYFAQRKYDLAQPCYAEAIPQLSEAYPNFRELKKRSDVLDELAVYAGNVTLQDSLLRLSQMPLDEQKKVIKKIIDDLKKKEKEEAENAAREEYMANQSTKGNQGTGTSKNAPTAFTLNNDNSWYFYNTTTKNAGKTAFQQQWGNRKLEDNWRRRNKNTFSFDDEQDAGTADTTATGSPVDTTLTQAQRDSIKRADDPHFEEYYLKQIPSTPEQIQTSNDVIQEGLYNMGLILKDKLEDFDAANLEFKELLDRYPDNIYRLDVYYNLYLLCMRTDQTAEAEKWRGLILSDFAESKYGIAMKDPAYLDNLKQMDKVQEQLYADTYDNYLNDYNEAVHEAYAEMMRRYPLSKLMPKFMFIDALAYVTQKNYDKFKEVLKELLERYPDTDITPTASAIMKQVKAGRQLAGGGSNARGMQWTAVALTNDTTGRQASDKQFADIKSTANKPQVFVLVYSTDSINSNILLYEVARHNFRSFNVRDYDLEKMTFGNMGLLVVKGFANYPELLSYRTVFDAAADFKPYVGLVHPVLISEENFNLLLSEGRSFEEYFRYLDAENEKNVEAKVPESATDDASSEAPAAKPAKSVRPGAAAMKPQQEPAQDKDEPSAKIEPTKPEEEKPQVTVVPENPDLVIDDGTKPVEPRPVQRRKPIEKPVEKVAEEKNDASAPTEAQPILTPVDDMVAKPSAHKVRKIESDEAKTEKEAQKAREKAEKERLKAEKEAQKREADSIKTAQKLAELKLKNIEKFRADSAKQAEKEAQRRLKAEQKAAKQAEAARQDSIKQAEKARADEAEQSQRKRADEAKAAAKAKEDARKQKEQERKQAAKAKEEARKQKEKERKERAKQKEKERKERAKQKEQERKAAAKAKEAERKARAAQRR